MSEQNNTEAAADGGQMTVWDAIRSRRDVRAFDGRPIPPADLDQILQAGRRSPSSGNWQPWDFIVATDRQQLTELAKVWRGGRHVAQSAATIALIALIAPASDEQRRARLDLGQATMSIMLAAAGPGHRERPIGRRRSATRAAAARLSRGEDLRVLDPAGLPSRPAADPVQKPDRRPFNEVVHRGRW